MASIRRREIKYSNGEQRILALLTARRASSSEIARGYYGKTEIPFHGRKIVIGLLSSLRRKADLKRDKFRVKSTKRSGPKAMEFWLETR